MQRPMTRRQRYVLCLSVALAAWLRGHRSNSGPGFESRQGKKVFRKNITMLMCVFDFKCIVCVLKEKNKGNGPEIFIYKNILFVVILSVHYLHESKSELARYDLLFYARTVASP
jgi:hypothetical protein